MECWVAGSSPWVSGGTKSNFQPARDLSSRWAGGRRVGGTGGQSDRQSGGQAVGAVRAVKGGIQPAGGHNGRIQNPWAALWLRTPSRSFHNRTLAVSLSFRPSALSSSTKGS